ncbi:MAG: phage major capsid protein [Pseudorhodobacter sp.]|nr:phage major capsid protein [Pseudorhodobacter sp.]
MRHASHPIIRAAFADFIGTARGMIGETGDIIVGKLWPRDLTAFRILTKADATPIGTADAPALAGTSVGDFFAGLAVSAGAKLIEAGLSVPLDGLNSVSIPSRTGGPGTVPFVGELEPIAVHGSTLASATLGPVRKMAVITVFSRELAKRSAAEDVFRAVLLEDAAASLDTALFDTSAASDIRPAGLLAGVTGIAATPGGDEVALTADFKALATALAVAGGSGNIVIVANPAQAAVIALTKPQFPWLIWPTASVPAGRVIAIDPTAFAVGFSDRIEIDTSKNGSLHMSDVPLEIVSGTGPTTADPIRDMFQTDSIALRLIAWATWTMRATGRIQFIEAVSW